MQKTQLNKNELFPVIDFRELPEILQDQRSRQEVLDQIQSNAENTAMFQQLTKEMQEAFLDFCMGNRGLQITYDPFFKKIFTKERLQDFLSAIMGEPVRVLNILPNEKIKNSVESSIMIMDVIVELSDGTIVDVEMQRITHLFPMKRAICYASDILVREYDKLKTEKGRDFSYKDVRPVVVIVLMLDASKLFSQYPGAFIHRSDKRILFDTGMEEENLHRYIFVSLDMFHKQTHEKWTELETWLYFLSSDNPKDISRLISEYPKFIDLYMDIIKFRYNTKEMLSMVSDAIRIMDDNAVKSMMEEMRDEITELGRTVSKQSSTINELKRQIIKKTLKQVYAKIQKGKSLEQIVDETEESLEVIEPMWAVVMHNPGKTVEELCELYLKQ